MGVYRLILHNGVERKSRLCSKCSEAFSGMAGVWFSCVWSVYVTLLLYYYLTILNLSNTSTVSTLDHPRPIACSLT
jgi:hypothetical protein